MDLIAAKLTDGVWLTGINQGKDKDDNTFVLQGFAFSNTSLEDFFAAFQKPGSSFKESTLNLMSINAGVGQNSSVHQFQITTKLAETNS